MIIDKFRKERLNLINILEKDGISDKNVLNAIAKVKRELFIDKKYYDSAYINHPLPIGCNQTISQPYTVAFMTQLLSIKSGEKVLEIGTGSGYQAAILYEMGAKVYSVERIEFLHIKAKTNLEKANYSITLKLGDGTLGWQEFSPFDAILVTAGSPKVPESLFQQLSVSGRLVIPVGDNYSQDIFRIFKYCNSEGKIKNDIKRYKEFVFVPLIGKEGWDYDL